MHDRTTPRIALAHDWLVGMRGGERVLERLAQLFEPTDIYTLVKNDAAIPQELSRCTITTSPLQHFPGASGRLRRHYLPLMPWAVERIKVKPCDLLISTSSAVMKSIIPPPGVPHICYCHSPARYIWEQTSDYEHGSGGLLRRFGLRMLRPRFQRWDRATAQRVTHFIANSQHTAARIKRCFDREAEVIYPPVRTDYFTPDANVQREDWLLVVAALEPYKRTDIVIAAANQARLQLKVVGDGSQAVALRSLAGPTVQMLGRVDDEQLRDLYRRARALVFPQVEDFGIIAVEAQACGCPVLAFAAGGAMEIVRPQTGAFFIEQSPEAILKSLKCVDQISICANDCRANAVRFSEEVFDREMRRVVERILK